jgi:hypothetical protein
VRASKMMLDRAGISYRQFQSSRGSITIDLAHLPDGSEG